MILSGKRAEMQKKAISLYGLFHDMPKDTGKRYEISW
jgi:hypothetical protein